jgi:hypothetical protein
MKDVFFVRIQEASKAQLTGYVGKLRGKVTDNPIRVRDLYCAAANVKNYSRFFLDTNFVDSIPDEHGERRFFIVKCSEAMIGNHEHFDKLRDTISDERVVYAFFDFLKNTLWVRTVRGTTVRQNACTRVIVALGPRGCASQRRPRV